MYTYAYMILLFLLRIPNTQLIKYQFKSIITEGRNTFWIQAENIEALCALYTVVHGGMDDWPISGRGVFGLI